MNITGGRWYRDIDKPIPLTRTGIQAIELMIQREKYTDICELYRTAEGENGTALIEWNSPVAHEFAVFEWE